MLKSGQRTLKKLYSAVVEILFPESCAGCGKKDAVLCGSCFSRIQFLNQAVPEKWIFPLTSYESTVRRLIQRIKYKNRTTIPEMLGRALFDRILSAINDELNLSKRKYLVIPMPITKTHLQKRGYNQAEKITRAILLHDTYKLYPLTTSVLLRKPETKSQVETKTRRERLENPKGSFTIKNKELLRESNIILIDDVVTTGATLREARKVLLMVGAKSVIAVTMAYTERK